jgi:hypothetical protein
MNKRDRMRDQIMQHGLKLNRIFNLNRMDVTTLAKQVHSIEVKAHKLAEDECNGVAVPENWEKKILVRLDKIINFKAKGVPIFVNGDPRGYALKIEDAWMKANECDLHRDWGGYGILAPEFDGGR